MDYDATTIPAGYDRGRDHGPEVLALWMRAVASHTGDRRLSRVLDLGCGTGRFSFALATYFDCEVVGIDPSTKMLAQARGKGHAPRVEYVTGSGERIPLPDASVDLVFISMVFHHFRDRRRVADECRRVLRPGGILYVRTATIEQIPAYPYVPFFPESVPLLESTIPPAAAIRETFEEAGLRSIAAGVIEQEIAASYGAFAEKLATKADSIIARLTPEAFEQGMSAVRRHGETVDPVPVVEPIDFFALPPPSSPLPLHASPPSRR